MPKAASKIKSFRRQGITILVLLLALGAYFAVRVPSQKEFFTQRSFRVLADMGNQINEALANLGSSLANVTRRPPALHTLATNGSPFLAAIARDGARPTKPTLGFSNEVRAALGLVPNLELLTAVEAGPTNASGLAGVSFSVPTVGGASWLELTYRGGSSNVLVSARCALDRLIEPIVNRGEFDDVLLVDACDTNGTVLFQLGHSSLRVARLAVPFDRSFQTNLVNYGGTDYLLFTQPFQAAGVGNLRWVLCGLVRADRFASQARSVSYTVLVMFTFLALLLVMSWPFLNVWSLGLKGGLRLGEVFLLIFSVVAVNAFLTLLALDLFARQRIHATTDAQLEAFAGEVEEHLQAELRQIARQMLALNDRLLTNAVNQTEVLTNVVNPFDPVETPYPYFGMAMWMASDTGEQLVKWTVKERNTPLINVGRRGYFQTVAESRGWLLPSDEASPERKLQYCLEPIFSANTGENLATFSLRPNRPTNDWKVVSALDCRLLSLVQPVLPVGFGFCVVDHRGKVLFHSDERRNLRENFFEECEQDPPLRAAVAGRRAESLAARYAGLDYRLRVQPLPELPWSLVVFREKLVWGTAQVEVISVAVLAFIAYLAVFAAVIALAYAVGARRSLAWLWPTPHRAAAYGLLTVVNVVLAALLMALVFIPSAGGWRLLAAVLLPPLAAALGLRALSRGWLASAWLRFSSNRIGLRLPYRVGYVLTFGTLLLVGATLPMVAFFKTAFETETLLVLQHTQLRLAQDFELRAQRLWSEMFGITGQQRTRGRPLAVASRRQFFDLRLTNSWDVYTRFFFDTQVRLTNETRAANSYAGSNEIPARESGQTPLWQEWLGRLRPHYNEQDVATRSVAGKGAEDGAWFWTRNEPSGGSLALVKTAVHIPTRAAEYQLRVASAEPRWGGFSALWGLVLLGLAGLPFGLVYVVAEKVLLLRADPAAPPSGSVLDPELLASHAPFGPGRYLLLGPARSGKSRHLGPEHFAKLEPGGFHLVDLRNPEHHKWLDPDQADRLLSETGKAIVVDSFEYRHADGEFTGKKLRFLQQLTLDEARTLVVVSNLHPLHFCLVAADGGKGKPEPAPAAAAAEWVAVLAAFRKLYVRRRQDPGSAAAPEGQTSHQARAAYRSFWATCSPAEQELLYEIAHGRLVNSYQPELAALRERGLLRCDPALKVADEPFRRFVLATHRPGATVLGPSDEAPGLWQSLKGPAITVLIILAAFFFATQKEMWNNSVVLITTFLTGIGAFAKAFEMFQKTRARPGPAD
jgi:hypothetical protein